MHLTPLGEGRERDHEVQVELELVVDVVDDVHLKNGAQSEAVRAI